MHISEWNNQQVKYKKEGALGQVKYVSHPVINQWTEDVVGERWEAEYTEEQKEILRNRYEKAEKAKWDRINARDEFAKGHFGFDQDRINEAAQFYNDLITIQRQEDEIADLERKIKELKENNIERQKRVLEGDNLIFKDLARDGCDKIKKANEALKENGLTKLCYGDLNSAYKLFKEIMG